MLQTWRAGQRFGQMLWHTLQGVRLARSGLKQLSAAQQQRAVEAWAQQLLSSAGVGLRVLGQPPAQGPVLLVSNHQSWLDIPVLHAARHCRFVSKAEIAHWPLVGHLAHAAGTLFVQRSQRRDTQRTVQAMVQALQQGDIVAVFPEGTTSNGRELLPFHGNMLQAAIEANVPVQPVAIAFLEGARGEMSYAPCEADANEPMLRSLWRTLRQPALVAVVHYGQAETANGRDRRLWAQDLRMQVQALQKPMTDPVFAKAVVAGEAICTVVKTPPL